MKKILVLVLALAMLLAGCETMSSIIGTTQQKLCNPTPEEQATAADVTNFLASGAVFAVPLVVAATTGAAVTVTPEMANAAFATVQAGLCVGATDLELALQYFSQLTAINKMSAAKMKALRPVPDATPLWNMLGKK